MYDYKLWIFNDFYYGTSEIIRVPEDASFNTINSLSSTLLPSDKEFSRTEALLMLKEIYKNRTSDKPYSSDNYLMLVALFSGSIIDIKLLDHVKMELHNYMKEFNVLDDEREAINRILGRLNRLNVNYPVKAFALVTQPTDKVLEGALSFWDGEEKADNLLNCIPIIRDFYLLENDKISILNHADWINVVAPTVDPHVPTKSRWTSTEVYYVVEEFGTGYNRPTPSWEPLYRHTHHRDLQDAERWAERYTRRAYYQKSGKKYRVKMVTKVITYTTLTDPVYNEVNFDGNKITKS